MAQPPAYTPTTDFSDYAANNPGDPMPGTSLDGEFANIKTTTDGIRTNLALIQKDDGTLANNSVGPDQLAASLTIGFNPPSAWATATDYTVNDSVFHDGDFYKALEAHTSGTFATDLAAEKWILVTDFNSITSDAEAARDAAAASASAASDDADATALDRIATGEDRVATGQDRTQTGSDAASASASATAAATALSSTEDARDVALAAAQQSEQVLKQPVRVATTAAGTLASDFEPGDLVDGVTLAEGDRILLKDQVNGEENGIYVVAASGAPSRSDDFSESNDVAPGLIVFVSAGTSNGTNHFSLVTTGAIVLGTTSLVFERLSFEQLDVASTAKAQAGTDNTDYITSLRMREGFNASGTAPVYACRAWVKFNGTGTVAIGESGNVSSITDNGAGDYTVNFATAMPDANYSVGGSVSWSTATWGNTFALNAATYSTTAVRFTSAKGADGTANDALVANLQVFR